MAELAQTVHSSPSVLTPGPEETRKPVDSAQQDIAQSRERLHQAKQQLSATQYVKDKQQLHNVLVDMLPEFVEMQDAAHDDAFRQDVLQVIANIYSELLRLEADLKPDRSVVYPFRLETARRIDTLLTRAQEPALVNQFAGQLSTYGGFVVSTAIRSGYTMMLVDALALQQRVNHHLERVVDDIAEPESLGKHKMRIANGYMSLAIIYGRLGKPTERIEAASTSIEYFDGLMADESRDGQESYIISKQASLHQDIASAYLDLGTDEDKPEVSRYNLELALGSARESISLYERVIPMTRDSKWARKYQEHLRHSERIVQACDRKLAELS